MSKVSLSPKRKPQFNLGDLVTDSVVTALITDTYSGDIEVTSETEFAGVVLHSHTPDYVTGEIIVGDKMRFSCYNGTVTINSD